MRTHLPAVVIGSGFTGLVFFVLVETALKGMLLFAAAALLALAMTRASAAARHAVWLAALSCALALPAGAWLLPQLRILPNWMRWEELPGRLAMTTRPGVAAPPAPAEASWPSRLESGGPATITKLDPQIVSPARPITSRSRWDGQTFLLIWLGGAAILLAPLGLSLLRLWQVSRRAKVMVNGRLADMLRALRRELCIRNEITLLLGDSGSMPMVWGLFRSHLLLPLEAKDWPHGRCRAVLLHELAHLRRRDPLSLVIGQLALALHWFNPLAWIALRRLRTEQELACDDYVIRSGMRPSEYATELLEVITTLRPVSFAAAALTMADPRRIEDRLVGILDSTRNRQTVTRSAAVALFSLAILSALPLAMLRGADSARPGSPEAPDAPGSVVVQSREGSPVQMEGWVFTWPSSRHGWYSERFDYRGEGEPGMISQLLKARERSPAQSSSGESLGTLTSAKLRTLLAAFRAQQDVRVALIEPFAVTPAAIGSADSTSTPFVAAGTNANVVLRREDQGSIVDVVWGSAASPQTSVPINARLSRGMSLAALFPGPAQPETIQMLVLHPVDPAHPFLEKQARGRILDREGLVVAENVGEARRYPLGGLASHLVGFTNVSSPGGSYEGRSGVEQLFDAELSEGMEVQLTINGKLQSAAEGAFATAGIARGAAVILDPKTGDLLASVSLPNYDPEIFLPAISVRNWRKLNEDPAHPLLDRTVQAYTPGSLFKLVTALAALRAGKADQSYNCPGAIQYGDTLFKCWLKGGHGRLNLREALAGSCDCYFYQLGNQVRIGALEETARHLGLGELTGLGLPGESAGIFPSPKYLRETRPNERWFDGYTANTAVGQGFTLATPLQMATMAAAFANGGRVLTPRMRDTGLPQLRRDLIEAGVSPEHLSLIGEVMRENVSRGNAQKANSKVMAIAGETATAQLQAPGKSDSARESIGWFIGYAPVEAPRYAFAIMVEGKSGAAGAAPIGRVIMEAIESGLPGVKPRPARE